MKLSSEQIEAINAKANTGAHEKSIADCLNSVYEYARKANPHFNFEEEKEGDKVYPEADYAYLRQILELSDLQLDILAVILEECIGGGKTFVSDIAKTLGMSRIKFMSRKSDLETLASKRYIMYNPSQTRNALIFVPDNVVSAISNNRKPSIEELQGLSMVKFTRQLENAYKHYNNGDIDFKTMMIEVSLLFSCNPDNRLVQAFNANHLDDLDSYEKALFIYMMYKRVNDNEILFQWEDYAWLFFDTGLISDIYSCIEAGELIIMKKGLVEHESSEGFEHMEYIRLTDKAVKEFLGDQAQTFRRKNSSHDSAIRVIKHNEILPKPLFFNESERKALDRLSNLLKKDNYEHITSRLDEKGMRKGVACLFYGAPGTGKTASCYNLSAATGRDLYFVDMAQIKSKWVGESEQNLSNLFKAYRNAVRTEEVTPIMVWNEADAIFGKRRNVITAVDKMENAMQNIILQELEDLEGILIATTNFSLKDGFDPAMERRFLIKVGFDKPETDIRAKIWQSMFTELSDTDAHTLATEYDYAGGLIENINRKATVDYILNGIKPNLDSLRELCRAERLGTQASGRIGF